jgi:hypothetical protein
VVIFLAVAGQASAATFYVNASHQAAADGNEGSETAPWKTLGRAVNDLTAGDVVIVKPGQYDEKITIKVSGSDGNLITLRAEPSRKARVKGFELKGDYISIEGFEITNDANKANGIFAGEAHRKTARQGNRMIHNFIHDIGGTGIVAGEKAIVRGNLIKNVFRGAFVNGGTLFEDNEIDTLVPQMVEKNGEAKPTKTQYTFFAGDDITFRGNYFHGAPDKYLKTGMGVCFFASWDAWIFGSSHRILIENNRCFNATHASEPTATAKKESSHITYRNNLFANTVFVGVMPKAWSHVTVENNTFINCGAYPVWLQGKQCETAVVRNNLITYRGRDRVVKAFDWKPAESGVRIDTKGPKGVCDYNLLFGCLNRGYGEHDFVAEPQFVDPDNGDFRLKPGSPGIDAGVTIEAIDVDLGGVKRPQGKGYDVGCYELKQVAEAVNGPGG